MKEPPPQENEAKEVNKENEEKQEEKKEGKKPTATGKGKSARPKSKMREMMEQKRKEMQQRNGMGDIVEDVVVEAPPKMKENASPAVESAVKLKAQEETTETDDFGFSDADFRSSEDFLR